MTSILDRRESFEQVALREVEVLYRVAKRLTLNSNDAEDLVGQTMLNAAKNWQAFDGRHARSWLIRILRNEWNQLLRKRKVRQEVDMESISEPSEEGFWQKVEVRLDVETILVALDTIGEDYRAAITLCDVEEMDYAEAAIALDIPQATLRTRLHRGRKQLQAKLVSLRP
ncbi:MAG: RNA polymerase sigma factor [Fimbriimonadaceae bacterium]|nr:RNA polymerase sigma factor [Fimbriimonadaceae bacterium]QYK56802.1 MAG: RNA polymerase sigma factor [Fimbriimonadaceae bacterium]